MKRSKDGQKYSFRSSIALLFLATVCLFSAMPAAAFRAETKADPGAPARGGAQEQAIAAKSASPAQALLAEQAKGAGIGVIWNDRLGTPQSVRGPNLGQPRPPFKAQPAVQAGASLEQKAVAILDNLSGLYAIRDATAEFAVKQTTRDTLGFQHVKLKQIYAGRRVVGGELITHFNDRGEAYEVNGQYVAGIEVDINPALQAEQAVQLAQNDLAALGKPAGTPARAAEPVIFAFNSTPRLAYELTLTYAGQAGEPPGHWRYWIDAHNGEIILRFNDLKFVAGPTTGSHTNITGSLLTGEGGGATNVTGWHNTPNGYYYLYNTNSHWIISNAASAFSAYLDKNSYAYRTNNAWGTSDRAEISAANNFHKTQQYFFNIHARASYDNSNALANANVHYLSGSQYNNAFWSPYSQQFFFYNGDGEDMNDLTVLDVAAHEFTHAVTEYSANLFYSFEPGALNESFSDIFGALVEFRNQPDGRSLYPDATNGFADWLIGEDCMLSATALRDMRNPSSTTTLEWGSQQPSKYHGAYWYYGSGDSGGVHYNSGVQNFFFYLLCQGGSGTNNGIVYNVTGIALTNAEQIAYRTLTVYLTTYSSYSDARDAWISAATDLNAGWAASVTQAWAAVFSADTLSSELGAAVNAPLLSWYTGGDTNWFAESTVTHDASLAAQSGDIGDYKMSKIYTPVAGPGYFSFWWKVSSEQDWDYLTFSIDGSQQTRISGEVDWQFKSYYLDDGSHILKWEYLKDSSVSTGYDAGWLDEVTLLLPLMIYASSGAYQDRVAVSWIPKADATGYEIWRAQGSADTNLATYLTTTAATNYNDTAVTAGLIYYYWVKAQTPTGTTDFVYAASGWRSWSAVPSGIAASDGAYTDKVRITWTASPNAVNGYRVYRNTSAADSGASFIGSTTDTVFDDTTAAAGVTYYYWIAGVDVNGIASGFSQPVTGKRAATPEPPDPDATNTPVLRATDFQMAPTVIQIGATPSTLAVRVANTGTSSTSVWMTLSVYLSSSGVFGSADNLGMGSVQRYVSLAAGQSTDVQLNSTERANFHVPHATTPGYYTAFLKATTTKPSLTNNVVSLANSVKVVASRLANRDDFDGDGKTDMAMYNESTGAWVIRGSATGKESAFSCGGPGFLPVAGDFDNDGNADLAVYQQSSGTWLFLLSGSLYGLARLDNFGASSFSAVSGDFDGDGKSDPAIYDTSTGLLMIQLSGSSYTTASITLGGAGYQAVSGDFDGDSKADPAVYSASSGMWQVMLSGNNYSVATAVLGGSGCTPVSGDFDGDLKSDPAVYQETDGGWAVMLSASSYATATARFGEPGFQQVSGDFDGDGKTDLTLYQTGYGNWYFRLSKTGYPLSSVQFGTQGFSPADIDN